MTPTEMETLADMIAARLMGTFAARLDMIEEVVFSGAVDDKFADHEKKSAFLNHILKQMIFDSCDDGGLTTKQIEGRAFSFFCSTGMNDHKAESQEKTERILSDMVSAGMLTKHKSGIKHFRYKSKILTPMDAF